MGNCCVAPPRNPEDQNKGKRKKKPNPFSVDYGVNHFAGGNGGSHKLTVLTNPTGCEIGLQYELGRELGRGEFGITHLCTDKVTGEKFACKSISKKKLRTAIDIEDVRREVQIMRHLPKHQNIVSLKDTFEDDNAVHLVMELCEGGELFDRIVARGHYTERAAAVVTKTIVEVVQMCHKQGVMHRDLKPENFLFGNKKENAPLKAIDFGLSVFFKPGERFNEIVGSPYYMAPEVLKRNYGPEVDVWSAGVILYILLCGVPPFWAETEQGVAQAIIRSVIDFKRDPWPKVSDNAKDLVRKMLDPDPKRRLTAQGVLDHPWLQNVKKAPNVSLGETVRARLKQFSVMNKLKKRALRVIAEHLSVEEVAGIKEGFEKMDTGNKGKINIDELRVGLHKLGHQIADADLQILMEAGDADNDGYLDCREFVAISVHLRRMGDDEEHLRKAFDFFDQNLSGYIEIEELRSTLADEIDENSEEVINAIINDVDTDKDGRISYDEFEFHQYVKNALIQLYSKCSDVGAAIQILYTVPGNDIFCYNLVVNGLLQHTHMAEAVDVLKLIISEGIEWNNATYVTIFRLCASLKDITLGKQVHAQMLKSDIDCDVYIGSSIIDMYGKCGNVLSGRTFFDRLQSRNVVSWTSIIAAYFQNEFFEEALNLFSKMEIDCIPPNEYTMAVLFNSAAGLSALCLGDQLHARAEKSGLKGNVMVGNALIIMYFKSGDILAAQSVFSNMTCCNIITWNAIITGHSHHGLGKEALSMFQDMMATGERPNYVTFIGVILACAHLKLVDEGFYYFNHLMKQFRIVPGLEHYTCIVGLLSRSGRLDEAENFMRSHQINWDVVSWRTLLNACYVHKHYDKGRKIAEYLLQLEPRDVGTYILLSNMHARVRRWDHVVEIRKLMRERNVKKEPGVSWLEIRNVAHVFTSEDIKHPEANLIYENVKDLLSKIRPLGYVPDIDNVLHDIEDEQKVDNLSYHSEKLAVAYGLMKTPSGAPITVIKNLRMCDDCHTAIKLISKVANRVIVVRDANRFHHFQNGCCSCGDYW